LKTKIEATDLEQSTAGSGDVTKAREDLSTVSTSLIATTGELAGFEKELKKLNTALINAEDIYNAAEAPTPEQEQAMNDALAAY